MRPTILVKYPSRQRPAQFAENFSRYTGMLSGYCDVQFLVSLDHDDPELGKYLAFLDPILEGDRHQGTDFSICVDIGHNRSKVEAINAGIGSMSDGPVKYDPFDILLLASDDMVPQVTGYDRTIADDMARHFPGFDGALNYSDGYRHDTLCTLSVMGRKLYEEFGYIYHPDYKSLWCDNEFTDVCMSTMPRRMVFIDQCIIRHDWMQRKDSLYMRNNSFFNADKRTYEARKALGFPKASIYEAALP